MGGQKIRKAVFPVAGLGTRFLPATKASPKEMLSVVDKPLIQYAVQEAVAAGISEMIFVTGRTKRAIEDHFDKAYELENELALKKRNELLRLVQQILPKSVNCVYIRQAEPLGLGRIRALHRKGQRLGLARASRTQLAQGAELLGVDRLIEMQRELRRRLEASAAFARL